MALSNQTSRHICKCIRLVNINIDILFSTIMIDEDSGCL